MSDRTIHVAVSVDIDRFPDLHIERTYLKMFRSAGLATSVAGIRHACAVARAQGFEVFPPCDRTKANGRCDGHEIAGVTT